MTAPWQHFIFVPPLHLPERKLCEQAYLVVSKQPAYALPYLSGQETVEASCLVFCCFWDIKTVTGTAARIKSTAISLASFDPVIPLRRLMPLFFFCFFVATNLIKNYKTQFVKGFVIITYNGSIRQGH